MNAPVRVALVSRPAARTSGAGPTHAIPAAEKTAALIDTERHLLACMVRDITLAASLPSFAAADFQAPGHFDIYEAIVALVDGATVAPTFLTVAASVEAAGRSCSGIRELEALVADTTQAAVQADLLLKASRRRQISAASKALATDPDNSDFAAALDRARELSIGAKAVMTSADAVADFRARLQRRMEGTDPAMSTGLPDLDRKLAGGLRGGQVVVLAARPGEGKSALAQGMAEHVATDNNDKVALFISLEMLAHEITERRVASASRGFVPLDALRSGDLSDEQLAEVERLMPGLSDSRMEFLASEAEDIDGIVATVKDRAKHGDVGLVVMDYLQLIESGSGNATENREQQVGKVCRRIKKLAMSLQIPVLLLSQLNREGEKGAVRRRPKMSDLRESGSIEQDADVIMFIHDDAPDEAAAGLTSRKTIIIAKQRAGAVGDVPVLWLGRECRFASLAHGVDDAPATPATPHSRVRSIESESLTGPAANILRVRQIAAASRGETAGIPANILAEVASVHAADEHAVAASPFNAFSRVQ
jgi:replicative DNA helicase